MSNDSRMKGNSFTKVIYPKVRCISYTSNPIGTLFSVWHGSRHKQFVSPIEVEELYRAKTLNLSQLELLSYLKESYSQYVREDLSDFSQAQYIIENVVKLAIKVNVQNVEFISYEFQVDDASVAWREQLVRKRQLHIWTQTSRVADMGYFNSTRMPTIEMFGGDRAKEVYQEAVDHIRHAYKILTALGVPSEDIRLQPQSYLHRVYFGCNLRQLLDLIKDRTSWIAQATLWMPIVSEIVKVLKSTLGEWILDYLKPPAVVRDGKIVEYDLESDDEARYYGKDPLPVSPIYLALHNFSNNYKNKEFYNYLKSMYINVWPSDILKAIDWDLNNPTKPGIYDIGFND